MPLRVLQVGYGQDPLARLADRLLADAGDCLPRLDAALVLMPDLEAAPRLRRLLLQGAARRGHEALLGPRIVRFSDWLSGFPLPNRRELDDPAQTIMLVSALRNHRGLFGGANLWALAASLLELFGEMTRHRVGVPSDPDAFEAMLARAYGGEARPPSALGREALLVHTLWHAWQEQLQAVGGVDQAGADLLRMGATLEQPPALRFYVAGLPTPDRPTAEWLLALAGQRPVTVVIEGGGAEETDNIHPDNAPALGLRRLGETAANAAETPYGRFLEQVFAGYRAGAPALASRAAEFAAAQPESPAHGRLALFAADSAEGEAKAVELQVRRWLLSGCTTVAVVTEDRRLARRVRALLERAGIAIQDRAGWALSTTSAAALLERWLECVEEDFPHLALLDLLKSPFLVPGEDERERHLALVYRLERDVILHENVGRGLNAYRQRLRYRQQRLPDALAAGLEPVDVLLAELAAAARPLLPYRQGAVGPAFLLDALLESLDALGASAALEGDAAGARVLQTLGSLRQAAAQSEVELTWDELRGWIGSSLEQTHFRPPGDNSPVTLSALPQSLLGRYDAVVIAGAERDHLPGAASPSPFFNDAVRRELGLPGGGTRQGERFYHFRRLLEAAPQVLVTYRREQEGEPVAASPWVESLQAFHRLAFDRGLADAELERWANRPETEVVDRTDPLPAAATQPAPVSDGALMPGALSASAYQQLVDCPYQFFAARLLGLSPPEQLRQALEKSDFGERVHRCLEAFHTGVAGLPGPFDRPLQAANRQAAEQLLERITEAVFARDLEDNFLHRGWRERWRSLIPAYLEWELKRASHWRVRGTEVSARRELQGLIIEGRLDRVDEAGGHVAVVDYKTGRVPDAADVLAGEAVQLPCYALLAEAETGTPVERVEYLELGRDKVTARGTLEGAELAALSAATRERLEELTARLRAGTPMPAWGDEGICVYCATAGLCRRQSWDGVAGESA